MKIGVSATSGSRAAFRAFIASLRETGSLGPEPVTARGWMIPIGALPKTSGERVLAVGDAAGQTKPTTGGGLYYGLLCARLAAEVLGAALRSDRLGAGGLAEYERRWRAVLGRELGSAQRFRRIYERLSDADIDRLFEFAAQDGIMRMLEEHANFDWHRRMLVQVALRFPLSRLLVRALRGEPLAEYAR